MFSKSVVEAFRNTLTAAKNFSHARIDSNHVICITRSGEDLRVVHGFMREFETGGMHFVHAQNALVLVEILHSDPNKMKWHKGFEYCDILLKLCQNMPM